MASLTAALLLPLQFITEPYSLCCRSSAKCARERFRINGVILFQSYLEWISWEQLSWPGKHCQICFKYNDILLHLFRCLARSSISTFKGHSPTKVDDVTILRRYCTTTQIDNVGNNNKNNNSRVYTPFREEEQNHPFERLPRALSTNASHINTAKPAKN